MREVEIGGRRVGAGNPVFIIAEAGVNHNGKLDLAKRLVDVAVDAGADAVKFQTFKAEKVMTADAPKAEYQKVTTSSEESQLEMAKRLELSFEDFRHLKAHCDRAGIMFLSTPFDEESVEFLDALGVAAFKVPSGEVINHPFLGHIARRGKPILLSTGMSCLGEVDEAVRILRAAGNEQLLLLHCVSNYPAHPADANLRAMQTMAAAFQVPVGFSDHTPGIEVALAAVALGACVIEKHFTLDRDLLGPDHRASLGPDQLAALVRGVRTVESALGHGRKEPAASEANTAAVARRSLVAARDIPAGMAVTRELIAIKRPGYGLPPSALRYIIGRRTKARIPADTMLELEMFS